MKYQYISQQELPGERQTTHPLFAADEYLLRTMMHGLQLAQRKISTMHELCFLSVPLAFQV